METEKAQNLHIGHRKRMKSTFLTHGLDTFDDYQVLEILLFYAVPKKDTNKLAHMLVNKFGSLSGVLEADYEELLKVGGVGENVASLIKFAQMTSKRYSLQSFSNEGGICLNSSDLAVEYCKNLFLGEKNELLYAIAVDDQLYIKDIKLLSSGTVNSVALTPRLVAEFVFKSGCGAFILTHNHPNGTPLPSREDHKITLNLKKALETMDIRLLDHIICGRDGGISMFNSAYFTEKNNG